MGNLPIKVSQLEDLVSRVAALEEREEQLDDDLAFEPAEPLLAQWRQLPTGGDQAGTDSVGLKKV